MLNSKKNTSGFTIIELLIIMAIIAFVSMLQLSQSKIDNESADARMIGQQLALYNNAVRSHISLNLDNQDYIDDVDTNFIGTQWLKNQTQCGGLSDGYFLPCEFSDTLGKTNLTYSTTVTANLGAGKLRAKTVIDAKNADGSSTIIGSTALGLALLTANGGKNMDAMIIADTDLQMNIDAAGNASSNILINSTDAQFYYCPFGLNIALLNPECSIDGVTIEGGLIVMITETSGDRDSLLRVDGSNTMKNNLRMNSAEALERQIIGANKIYNITGEILKMGNSGVYFEGDWIPIIGDGLVIDTDLLAVGSSKIKGDLDTAGDLIANTNIISERSMLTGQEIITEGDSEITGDQYILGNANYNGNVAIFGTIESNIISSNTFLEANEISALNNISSNTIVNAPVVRASAGLYSEGNASISGDAVTSGNSYTGGTKAVQGVVATASDLVANQGTSYLGNVFASAIFDTDGDYMIDPSGTSRTNITRAERISPSTSGQNIKINGNKILFAAESGSCTTASASCATNVGGYVDMDQVMIKSPGDGNWIGFIDYLNGLEQYVGSN